MLYSDEAASKFAMTAHFGVFGGGLYLLLSLMQMGTADTARRMRAERELSEQRSTGGARRRAHRASSRTSTPTCAAKSACASGPRARALMQLERLDLLRRITHAIAERQDLAQHLPGGGAQRRGAPARGFRRDVQLRASRRRCSRSAASARAAQPLALELAMTERSRIEIDQNGLSRCVGR